MYLNIADMENQTNFTEGTNTVLHTNNWYAFLKYHGVVMTCLGVFIISGNILTLVALSKYPLLRIKQNLLIGSLSVADLCVGISAIIWITGVILWDTALVWDPTDILMVICNMISCFNLIVIGLNRFIAISMPFRYNKLVTRRNLVVLITAAWILPATICLVVYIMYGNYIEEHGTDELNLARIHQLAVVVSYVISCTILGGLYGIVIAKTRRQSRKIHSWTSKSPSNEGVQVSVNRRITNNDVQSITAGEPTRATQTATTCQTNTVPNSITAGQLTRATQTAATCQTNTVPNSITTGQLIRATQTTATCQTNTVPNSITTGQQIRATQTATTCQTNTVPNSITAGQPIRATKRTSAAQPIRGTKLVLVIMFTFLITMFPYTLHSIIRLSGKQPSVSVNILEYIGQQCLLVNSAINVLVYSVFVRNFRKAYKYMLCGCSNGSTAD